VTFKYFIITQLLYFVRLITETVTWMVLHLANFVSNNCQHC